MQFNQQQTVRHFMSASSRMTCGVPSVTELNDVNHPVVRPAKLTRPVATAQAAIQHKQAKKARHRIPPVQRIRVMQRYASGENQTAIARNENLNRESVGRIVKSEEMEQFTEEIRERWRGLCDEAIQSVRRLIAQDDKQTVYRVLESNGIVAPQGAALNHIQPAAKPSQDDRMKTLRACFADVMMERAKVFKTPFPELADIAKESNIQLDFELNSASDEAEEDEI
jgi:hypothetical protein